jgi:MFS family permease
MTDKEAIRALLASAPVGALLVVLLGWVLGSLLGGFLAAWIGWNAPVAHALVLGGLLTLAGIANNLMLPPPVWFWITSLVALLPAAYAGARLAPRRNHAQT